MAEYQVIRRLVRNKDTEHPGTTWGYDIHDISKRLSDSGAVSSLRRERFADRTSDRFFVVGRNERKNYVIYYDDDDLGLTPTTEADKDATNNLRNLKTVSVDEYGRRPAT